MGSSRVKQAPLESDFRRLMLARIAILFAVLLLVGTLVRHFASAMPARVLITNSIIALVFCTVPLLRKQHSALMLWTFLFGFSVLILNGGILAGGINAPICVLLPLIPIVGFCFGGARFGLYSLLFGLVLTAGLIALEKLGLTGGVLDPSSISIQRATVMFVVLITAYTIGYIYETIRKQNERRIVEFSRLASLGTMAGGIAHEINNPLSVLAGYTEQLRAMAPSDETSKARYGAILEKMQKSCARIARIVAALHQYANDEHPDQLKELKISDLVADALPFCEEKFLKAGIEIRTKAMERHVNAKVFALPNATLEVILEILNNAYAAIVESGATEIRWVAIGINAPKDFVSLQISNSGPTIQSDIGAKVFIPFFTTREVGKGTGLGLSLCASNMRRMGGDIYLDQKASQTTFVLQFRKASPQVANEALKPVAG